MKFDYIVMNPPFCGPNGTENMLYRKIIERMMKKGNVVSYIAPTGGLGVNMWRAHKSNIYHAERLGFDVFPVGITCVRALWKVEPTKTFRLVTTGLPIGIDDVVKTKDFPKIPDTQMSYKEYQKYFGGINPVEWSIMELGKGGVYRFKKEFRFSSDVLKTLKSTSNVKLTSNAKYLPCSKKEGEELAEKLTNLFKEGKIHGYWGFGHPHVTQDLPDISRKYLKGLQQVTL